MVQYTVQAYYFAAFLDPRFKQFDPFVAEIDREDVVEEANVNRLVFLHENLMD